MIMDIKYFGEFLIYFPSFVPSWVPIFSGNYIVVPDTLYMVYTCECSSVKYLITSAFVYAFFNQ